MNKYILGLFILAGALSVTSCDKDDVDTPVSQADYFRPTRLVDEEDGETMRLIYNSDNQLVSFSEFMFGEMGTLRISYNPLLMRADEVTYKDFTFDDKGRVTSFKVYSDDDPFKSESDIEFEYEGAYLKCIKENYHTDYAGDSKMVKVFEWNNGNLVKITQTDTYDLSIGSRTSKSWADIKYTDIPAKQWSMGFLWEVPL